MKVGDKVEIIGEDMYIRTGYPIGFREAERKLNGAYSGSFLSHLMKQFPFLSGYKQDYKIIEQFVLAYNAQHLKFGGMIGRFTQKNDQSCSICVDLFQKLKKQ